MKRATAAIKARGERRIRERRAEVRAALADVERRLAEHARMTRSRWVPPNVTGADSPVRAFAKRMACTWTSWERVEEMAVEAFAEAGWAPPAKGGPKRRAPRA